MSVQIKRIYDDVAENDGKQIIVDRIWPRGVSKERAQLDEWLKGVAPITKLRQWFNHDPKKFAEFKRKYEKELKENEVQSHTYSELKDLILKYDVTLLYAAKEI